jgi:plasmid stability protein
LAVGLSDGIDSNAVNAYFAIKIWIANMATLTIRNVDESTKSALRLRAARNGVSVEQEVRTILDRAAVENNPGEGESLYRAIRRLVEPHGGFEIELPERGPAREPPKFD